MQKKKGKESSQTQTGKKHERTTGVLQKLGFSAKLNFWNSNELCAKFEHSYF
jgi:hypothetical protein